MLDTINRPPMQRTRGRAEVGFARRSGRTALQDLHQQGAAKVMLPRVCGDVPEVVFLNTSGGLTGGDRLAFSMDVAAGCRVTATTQTAERGYATMGGAASLAISAKVGTGARLDWMPQETILFQDSDLQRSTTVDLGRDATCLVTESLVLGRQAMGETLHRGRLLDHRMIRRQGRPVWAETFRLDSDSLADQSAALLADCRALALICLVTQGAEDATGAVRLALGKAAAVSGWNGRCVVRLCAADGWSMRQDLAKVLKVLTGRPLPRVWQSGGLA